MSGTPNGISTSAQPTLELDNGYKLMGNIHRVGGPADSEIMCDRSKSIH